ncbi:MAG: RNA polymerase sigma-70 factor [Chitinophagaceae bacterium]|nr:RNA polymerase sigma-70 factor [Chitinophagaceae bacterium]
MKSTTLHLELTVAIREMQERIAFYEDMKAYNQLFELLSDGIFRFTYSLVKSNEVAEEIVSDVFIKLWQIRDRLPEIENLKVYLYTIAKNFSLNYLTKHYKNTVISLEELDVESVIEFNGPAEMCISADLIQQIRRIIRQLPPQCRLIFQLVKEEGLKYKEVATVLDISPLTVRNQLAIAIRKIGEALPAYLQSDFTVINRFSPS